MKSYRDFATLALYTYPTARNKWRRVAPEKAAPSPFDAPQALRPYPMDSYYEGALRQRYLRYIKIEISFISRHDFTAKSAHQSVCDMIGSLRRYDLITLNEAIELIAKADGAMALATERQATAPPRLLWPEK